MIKQHEGRNYELRSAHVNPANVRTLKTIGFDRSYVRAEGPYLWDVQGTKYLVVISEEDVTWFLTAFEDVLVQMHKFPGPAWDVVSDIGKMVITSRAR